MRYATAAAFRQALDDRLKTEAAKTGLGLARLRRRVAFELLLRRLVAVAPDRWVLKGALALDFRFHTAARATRDMDLGRADDEDAVVEDFGAVQELVLDDFFTFAVRRTDAFDEADDFRAIRFHVTAQLAGRTFDQFVVDVGFSDSISWTPDRKSDWRGTRPGSLTQTAAPHGRGRPGAALGQQTASVALSANTYRREWRAAFISSCIRSTTTQTGTILV